MGKVSGGEWLSLWVSVDATIVLSGAVLTGYVGVGGLALRMTLDRCLPQFLLSENPITHTCHFIIVGFFLITTSLFVIVNGQTTTLAGVYGIAFLGGTRWCLFGGLVVWGLCLLFVCCGLMVWCDGGSFVVV
jgi:amino acid transporter